jgi:SAM-dependent methyltransferase
VNDSHLRHNEETFAGLVAGEKEYFRWQSAKVELIASTLRSLKPHGVLADVGCFTGLASAIYHAAGFQRTIGFDSSRDALAVAGTRGVECRFWRIGQEPCPAKESAFDAMVVADVIEHIVDTDGFLDELWRVLKPDGVLILTTPNLAFWLSRLRLLRGKPPWSYPGPSSTVKADLMVDLNHIRITTRSEWKALFRARSFQVVETRGWSILHAQGNSIGMRIRRFIDRRLTVFPDLAFGLLFVLRKMDHQ